MKALRTDAEWVQLVEDLIAAYSTKPRKRGKYKGHVNTDPSWIKELATICWSHVVAHNKGRMRDNNMALARLLGRVLVIWYCTVQRAKSFDPSRTLERRKANAQVTRYRARLMRALMDDALMGAVFGKKQQWNFPYGNGARGGDFE